MGLLTPAPFDVRAMAIGLTVLAHAFALALLIVEHRMSRREPEQQQLQFVSIWPEFMPPPMQPQPAAPPRARPARAASAPGVIASALEPQVPVLASTGPSSLPTVPGQAQPPVDWALASRAAAERVAAEYGKPEPFGRPPNTDLPAKLCRPRQFSEATQAQMDELLPPPPEPASANPNPFPDSVMLPGGIRVGMVSLGVPVLRKPTRGIAHDREAQQPESSVPDPNKCD